MNKDFQPLNIDEQLQYAQLQRLDAIVDMMSSLLKVYAEKNEIAVENVEEEVVVEPVKRTRKSVKK
jgi:hypothetical protein